MKIKLINESIFKPIGDGAWKRIGKNGKEYIHRKKTCLFCNEDYLSWRNTSKYCSNTCRGAHDSGEKSATWKGGKTKTVQGYIMVKKRDHPFAVAPNFRIAEHRLEMEKKLGRYLNKDEHVHHLNGIKHDNRIQNLVLITKSEHSSIHMKERWKNPKFSSLVRNGIRKKWKNKNWKSKRAKQSRLCLKKQWENPIFKANQSKKAILQWKDPAFRSNQAKKLRVKWEDPAFRAKVSKINRLNALASWKRRKNRSQFNLS